MAQQHVHSAAQAVNSRRAFITGVFALLAITLVAYWPALGAGFIWDDDSYLTENSLLQSIEGLGRIWIPRQTPQYYPAVFTTFWIEHHLWGLHPLGYHLVNVMLHALNAILLWRLCLMLKIPGAWWIGAVFAVHPINVESVAWITERKNVLSGCFYLASALMYLRFDDQFERRANAGAVWRGYAISLVLFVLALLSKTVTCSLPAALILMMLWRRKRLTIARVVPLLPMFAIGFALAMHTAWLERVHVGTWMSDFDFDFGQRLMIAARALWFYVWKIIVPWPVMFIYPRWDVASWTLASAAALIGALAVAVACVAAYLRGWRGVPLALAFYAGTIFPALGFFDIYPMRFSFVADHFTYLASLGVFGLVVAIVRTTVANHRLAFVIGASVIALLTALTHIRCFAYENEEVLWRWTIAQNPEAWIAHNNLGRILVLRGEHEEAVKRLRSAVELRPDLDDLRANLANALRLAGNPEAALKEYQAIQSRSLLLPQDQIRFAQALADLERTDEADAAFRQAMAMSGQSDDARVIFGAFLAGIGRHEEAVMQLRQFAAVHPRDGFIRLLVAESLLQLQRTDEAVAQLREALSIARSQGDEDLALQAERRLTEALHGSDAGR